MFLIGVIIHIIEKKFKTCFNLTLLFKGGWEGEYLNETSFVDGKKKL